MNQDTCLSETRGPFGDLAEASLLVEDFTKYEHSSAGFYELGEVGKFSVKHYKDLHDDRIRHEIE